MIPDAVAARSVKACLNLPLVTLAIGSDILVYPDKMPGLEKQLRDTLAHTDLAVGVSDAVCSRLAELGARRPLCVTLGRDTESFFPAVDKTALRQEIGLAPDAVVAVMVGRLVSSKGIHELVQAVRALSHLPHFRLLCVGDGPDRASMASLGPVCVMAGERTPEEVAGYLQAADFLVHPSHSEGMPQVVLEAMSCGLPVVATSVGGIPEAVIDGDNGLLVPPQDAQALCKALKRMITDQSFREQAGQRSLSVIAERFDGEAHAERMARAIKSLHSAEAGVP
jgi:glycosyltransferase involved in cell wall biosynthesis